MVTQATSRSSVSRSKHTLHEMHLRMGVSISPNALRGQYASATSARQTATKSALPAWSMPSASSGSMTRPAMMVGMPTALAIGRA